MFYMAKLKICRFSFFNLFTPVCDQDQWLWTVPQLPSSCGFPPLFFLTIPLLCLLVLPLSIYRALTEHSPVPEWALVECVIPPWFCVYFTSFPPIFFFLVRHQFARGKKRKLGAGDVEHVLYMYEAVGLTPSTRDERKKISLVIIRCLGDLTLSPQGL